MIQAEDIPVLIKKVNDLKGKMAKHEGALDQMYKELENTFGFKTFEEAEEGLKRLDEEIAAKETKLDSLLEEIDRAVDWNKI